MVRKSVAASVVAIAVGLGVVSHAQPVAVENRVAARRDAGQPAIGTFTQGAPNLDFVVIDAQYGDFDLDAIEGRLQALKADRSGSSALPVVRIPLSAVEAPEAVVGALIELGVPGIMFPDIETPAQAVRAIASLRDASEAGVWPEAPSGQLLAMVQIESTVGIDQLDAVLDVPGIGVIFLGPTALAGAIGADGPDAPEVEVLVQQALAVCVRREVACGYPIVARSAADAEQQRERRLGEGFKVLAVMTVSR